MGMPKRDVVNVKVSDNGNKTNSVGTCIRKA